MPWNESPLLLMNTRFEHVPRNVRLEAPTPTAEMVKGLLLFYVSSVPEVLCEDITSS